MMPALTSTLTTAASAFFSDIIDLHEAAGSDVRDRYKKLYRSMQLVMRELTDPAHVQLPNLFARVRYLTDQHRMGHEQTLILHDVRVKGRELLRNKGTVVTEEDYVNGLKVVCEAVSLFTGQSVPAKIRAWLPLRVTRRPLVYPAGEQVPDARVIVETLDLQKQEITCRLDEAVPGLPDMLTIRYGAPGFMEEFAATVALLWAGAHLYLIGMERLPDGSFLPRFMVLEPDYLMNVKEIADCVQWKWDSTDPRLHFISKFSPVESKPVMLLGNVANAFLDALVNEAPDRPGTFQEEFLNAFRLYPFEFAALFEGAEGNANLKGFVQDAKEQYHNLRSRMATDSESPPLWKNRRDSTLEPSFYSARFGIQGRLDMLLTGTKQDRPQTRIVELKGGTVPKALGASPAQPWASHAAQARLYRLLIGSIPYLGGLQQGRIQPYILYSKDSAPDLVAATAFAQEDRRLINLRNRIVALEYQWLQAREPDQMLSLLKDLDEARMPAGLPSFTRDKFSEFRQSLESAPLLEQRYAAAWVNFIAAEHYLNRVGEPEADDSSRGLAGLWRTSRAEKLATSDILTDLTLDKQCYAGTGPVKELKFIRPAHTEESDGSTSFRVGDMCVLYPYDHDEQNVLDHQLYKGNIATLTDQEIVLHLRQPQTGRKLFNDYQKWALEGDASDKLITDMYRNVGTFLQCADAFKRKMILGLEQPRFDTLPALTAPTLAATGPVLNVEQQLLLRRMLAARDYFLLVGPPGTGKTSVMLKHLTRELFARPQEQILLLAFTNRAVDEICDALTGLDFIRVGSELSTEERHRPRLLDRQMASCATRDAVLTRLADCRIYVGTLAGVQGKPLLFQLKTFTTAVIDEASQILEPQLIGLLPKVGRFLLIGDHKQLPAITVQPVERSRLPAPELLHTIGLLDRRGSFFERLLRCSKTRGWSDSWGMLSAQGRMHEVLARFPNHAFYGNQLTQAGLAHQQGELSCPLTNDSHDPLEFLLSRQRIVYVPSTPTPQQAGGQRRHEEEARLVARLTRSVQLLYEREGKTFDPLKTVGIITPYRNQVATIRREMECCGIADHQNITVDTVERYQGSQRDIIIVSCCLNNYRQLTRMVSLMEDEDVDRKLNVLLTRARHQLIILGAESIMAQDRRYFRLVEFIKSRGGYVEEGVTEVLNGRCRWKPADPAHSLAGTVYSPDSVLGAFFDTHVVAPVREDKRTAAYPLRLLGNHADFNRNVLLNYGRADFDESVHLPSGVHFTPQDRVNLYCYYNMRKHFFSSLAVFNSVSSLLSSYYASAANPRVLMVDFGCGPFTAGLALAHSKVLAGNSPGGRTPQMSYVGLDRSHSMLERAAGLATACPIASRWKTMFTDDWNKLDLDMPLSAPAHLVLLNFSYFFASDSLEPGGLADWVSALMERYPLHRYALVVQNTAAQQKNANYFAFRRLLRPSLQQLVTRTETVSYLNQEHSRYDKSETVFYELLATN